MWFVVLRHRPEQNFVSFQETLNDDKRSKLSRSALKALCKDLKLNKDQYEKLKQILSYPPGQNLSAEEQEFIWKYRYFLSKYPKALAKFLQSVHWDRPDDVKEALSLLQDWISLDTDDALELLGPIYHHPKVRSYAVTRLRQTSDEVRRRNFSSEENLSSLGSSSLLITISSSSSIRPDEYFHQ